MMKVLLNFFPVQSGGGQQVAYNFLKILSENDYGHKWYLYVGQNSELHNFAKNFFPTENILTTKYSYKARILNWKLVNNFISDNKIDIIYNYGPTLNTKHKLPQVVRSVYSNLYFPEIDFWRGYSIFTKIKKKIIDNFRLRGTINADALVFENLSMKNRSEDLFHFPSDRTVFIEPSVTNFENENFSDLYKNLKNKPEFKILYLSSWHMNKNIHILPEVASVLQQDGIRFEFILSLEPGSIEVQKWLMPRIRREGLHNHFIFIGKVPAKYVHQVISSCDAMILLSKLECFSSNIIEAFSFQKPLIISDEHWSRSVCGDSVLYVDRDNASDIANGIKSLVEDKDLQKRLVNSGINRLQLFNAPEEKVTKQVQFLEKIYMESVR